MFFVFGTYHMLAKIFFISFPHLFFPKTNSNSACFTTVSFFLSSTQSTVEQKFVIGGISFAIGEVQQNSMCCLVDQLVSSLQNRKRKSGRFLQDFKATLRSDNGGERRLKIREFRRCVQKGKSAEREKSRKVENFFKKSIQHLKVSPKCPKTDPKENLNFEKNEPKKML